MLYNYNKMWQITLELTVNADYCLIKYVYSYILKKLEVACLFKLKRATLPAVGGESITIPDGGHLACCQVSHTEWMVFEVLEMVISGKDDGFRRSAKNQNRVMGVIPIS